MHEPLDFSSHRHGVSDPIKALKWGRRINVRNVHEGVQFFVDNGALAPQRSSLALGDCAECTPQILLPCTLPLAQPRRKCVTKCGRGVPRRCFFGGGSCPGTAYGILQAAHVGEVAPHK